MQRDTLCFFVACSPFEGHSFAALFCSRVRCRPRRVVVRIDRAPSCQVWRLARRRLTRFQRFAFSAQCAAGCRFPWHHSPSGAKPLRRVCWPPKRRRKPPAGETLSAGVHRTNRFRSIYAVRRLDPTTSFSASISFFFVCLKTMDACGRTNGSSRKTNLKVMPDFEEFPISNSSSLATLLADGYGTTLDEALDGGRLYRNRVLSGLSDLPGNNVGNEDYVTIDSRLLFYRWGLCRRIVPVHQALTGWGGVFSSECTLVWDLVGWNSTLLSFSFLCGNLGLAAGNETDMQWCRAHI